MKLYSQLCLGLLFVFVCRDQTPVAISDFCLTAGPEIARLRGLSDAETAALTRPRKEAILNLRRSYERNCKPKPSPSS